MGTGSVDRGGGARFPVSICVLALFLFLLVCGPGLEFGFGLGCVLGLGVDLDFGPGPSLVLCLWSCPCMAFIRVLRCFYGTCPCCVSILLCGLFPLRQAESLRTAWLRLSSDWLSLFGLAGSLWTGWVFLDGLGLSSDWLSLWTG